VGVNSVSVYEGGLRPGYKDAARRGGSVADAGTRGTRRPADAVGRAHIATSQNRQSPGLLAQWLGASLRLVFPVILLVAVGAASVLYDGVSTNWPAVSGTPLSLGLVLLPLSFFAIHLTNRRYGAGYAFAQILASWLVACCMAPYVIATLNEPVPDLRIVAAFAAGLFVAQISVVIVFDRLRGPNWWRAPFVGSLFGGVVFCLIAFPAAYAGTPGDWQREMLSYMIVSVLAAAALVIPYWLLRSLVPPRPGFGGY